MEIEHIGSKVPFQAGDVSHADLTPETDVTLCTLNIGTDAMLTAPNVLVDTSSKSAPVQDDLSDLADLDISGAARTLR